MTSLPSSKQRQQNLMTSLERFVSRTKKTQWCGHFHKENICNLCPTTFPPEICIKKISKHKCPFEVRVCVASTNLDSDCDPYEIWACFPYGEQGDEPSDITTGDMIFVVTQFLGEDDEKEVEVRNLFADNLHLQPPFSCVVDGPGVYDRIRDLVLWVIASAQLTAAALASREGSADNKWLDEARAQMRDDDGAK